MYRIGSVLLMLVVLASVPSSAISGAWWDRPTAPLPTVTDLYVDSVTGDDSESCGFSSTLQSTAGPCRTIQAAVDRIPVVFENDFVIHLAAGSYGGEIMIADRVSPNRSYITLRGEPEAEISGNGQQERGLTIWRTPGVILENLVIREFTGPGMVLAFTSPVMVLSTTVAENGGHGINARHSAVTVDDAMILNNGGSGIACDGGWVTIGGALPYKTVRIQLNQESGILVDACRAVFAGQSTVDWNRHGLFAMHGGMVDLALRSDVVVQNNSDGEMIADCVGHVSGYINSCENCSCLELNNGICTAGTENSGGGDRDKPWRRER